MEPAFSRVNEEHPIEMTDLSQRIFDYLSEYPHVSMGELERAMGVHQRGLQSEGNTPGPFRVAIKEIYAETGWFVFSRSGSGGGVMLTRDRELTRHAGQRLWSQGWRTTELADEILKNVEIDERKEKAREPFALTP